jgi:formylglycine-generating enzyme required for sulfatase activity
MSVQDWKKIIATFVVIAFIGVGMTWALEQSSPQFQEKPGTSVAKKHKRFPLLLAVLGVGAVVAAVVLLIQKKTENSKPDPPYTPQAPNIEMVSIPGGTFWMGSTSSEAESNEQPVHAVTLSSFSIGKYEVTQGQWKAVMGTNPSQFQKGDNYPVEQVSWDDCDQFIKKLNQLTGRHYRLPTEAEWEYACRAGTTGDRYGDMNSIAWYDINSGNTPHPVGEKPYNAFGLHDTLGNVSEWCQDYYGLYSSEAQANPKGPTSGTRRLGRGGSWASLAHNVRASDRASSAQGGRYITLGFRLALD